MDQLVPLALLPSFLNSYANKIMAGQRLGRGVILEVFNVGQAVMAQDARVNAITISEPISGGISRMTDPSLIKKIKRAVKIPIVARARVGHYVEAQILDEIGVDFIDESEVLSIADGQNFIDKHQFNSFPSSPPFICGAQSLGEALNRLSEGAAMIRIQGDYFNSGNIVNTVKNVRSVNADLRTLNSMPEEEVYAFSR